MVPKTGRWSGFSLVELLIVIAVIGILSALIISAISNATDDSRFAVARQQQVVLQEALNSWIAAQSSVAEAQSVYATNGNKLSLITGYLRNEGPGGGVLFSNNGGAVSSEILDKVDKRLQFSGWTTNAYPSIILTNE